jgi:phosphomethylpyrimidine synthase
MSTTQMEAAKQNKVTSQMKLVAAQENMDEETIRKGVAVGSIVIPCNAHHSSLIPHGIGSSLQTKVNVNIGTSKDCADVALEMQKAHLAMKLKVESIMDLSSFGDTQSFRKKLVQNSTSMIGTVPIYDAIVRLKKPLADIRVEDWLQVLRIHSEDGIDFVTLHCGMNKNTASRMKQANRCTNIVSRGGAIMFAWMELTGNENPFFEHFDEVLDICAENDMTLSLGDACRPGSIEDSGDVPQLEELIVLSELTQRAWKKNIQVIIEGPGHVPINQIAEHMKMQKVLCEGAPYYVLGPLVTDIAPGYDHITAAIGGAIAASNGAAFLCYVTPAEHLRLPTLDDVKEGIIASKIAAHAADIAKNRPGATQWDHQMSTCRKNLDWEGMFRLAIDPEKARLYRKESKLLDEHRCTMCGEMCAIRNINQVLQSEEPDYLTYSKEN